MFSTRTISYETRQILGKNIDKGTKNHIQKLFLTKCLTNKIKCITFRIVKGTKPDDQIRKYLWGPGIQTPSYILSPLDLEPQNKFRMPISFSPFLPFGAFGNTAGNDGVFFINNKNPPIGGFFIHIESILF